MCRHFDMFLTPEQAHGRFLHCLAGNMVTHPRPASAPSPTAVRGATALAGGPFAPDQAAPDGGGSATWRAFEALEATTSRHAARLDSGATSDEEWQPFQDSSVDRSSDAAAAEHRRRPMDAWANDQAPPAHTQSVPVSWGTDMGRPRNRAASATSEVNTFFPQGTQPAHQCTA